MNAARHITRIIARFVGSVSEVADAEGLRVTTVRESGKVTVTVTHPEGLTALSATFTSPPARSPKPTVSDGKQVTLEEVIARKSSTQGQDEASLPSLMPADDERPEVGDHVTLDGVAVEVLGVDAEGFIWRTVPPGERDEGDTAWSDARRVGPGVWETKPAEAPPAEGAEGGMGFPAEPDWGSYRVKGQHCALVQHVSGAVTLVGAGDLSTASRRLEEGRVAEGAVRGVLLGPGGAHLGGFMLPFDASASVTLHIPETVWARLEERVIEEITNPVEGEPAVASVCARGASVRTLGPMTKEAASIVQMRANANGVDVLDIDDLPARGKAWRESFDTMDSKRLDVQGACVIYGNHKDYRRKVREAGQTEESWLHSVAEVLTFPWVHVARLYSKTGVCLWDSRDGGAPKTCPPRKVKVMSSGPKLIPDATPATAMPAPAERPKDETTRAAKGSRKLPKGAKGAR